MSELNQGLAEQLWSCGSCKATRTPILWIFQGNSYLLDLARQIWSCGSGKATLIWLISQDNPDPIWDGGWQGDSDLLDLAGQLSYDFVLGRELKDNSDLVDLAGQLWSGRGGGWQGNCDLVDLAGQSNASCFTFHQMKLLFSNKKV